MLAVGQNLGRVRRSMEGEEREKASTAGSPDAAVRHGKGDAARFLPLSENGSTKAA
jgi:hypothetical protein